MRLLQRVPNSGNVREIDVEIGSTQVNNEQRPLFFFSGSPIIAGDSVTLYFPNGFLINGYTVHTNNAATLALDIRAVQTLPADSGDSIAAPGGIVLENAHMVSDGDLFNWQRAIEPGSIVVAEVTSVTGEVRNFTLQFFVTESADGMPVLWFVGDSAEMTYNYTSPSILFGADTVEEFPTYTHTTEIERTPELLFGASDVEQYPTYVQADPAPFVFDAGVNDNVNQWVKYSRTFSPTSGAPGYSYVVTGLPTGLAATTENSVLTISGIPEVTGTFVISVEVTDRIGRVVSDSYSVILYAADRTPVIESVIPHSFAAGDIDFILGYNFGVTPQLFIGAVDYTANIISAVDSMIEFTVPVGITNPSDVYITAFGQDSAVLSCDFS